MQQHRVDAAGALVHLGHLVARGRQYRGDPAAHLRGVAGRGQHCRGGPACRVGEQVAQRPEVGASSGDDAQDRHPERDPQGVDVERSGPPRQLVGEREHDAHGQLGAHHLGQQPQGPAQRGGIEGHDETVGCRSAGLVLGREEVGDDLLVGTDRVQAVGAGEVLQDHRGALDRGGALVARDGHPRIVTGLGPQPGQRVEEGGLAGVRASDEGDPGGLAQRRGAGPLRAVAHCPEETRMHRASVRRRATS